MKPTHQIFISYTTRGDADAAFRLVDLLEASGIKCWIAPRDIDEGENWADAIPNAIEGCHLVVLLLSDQSMASEEIKKEVNLANSRNKKILPVRLENIPLRASFEYHLATKQWIDAIEGDFDTRFTKTIQAATREVARDIPAPQSSLQASGRAQQAKEFVSKLNHENQTLFSSTNTFLSLHIHDDKSSSIRLPIRFATCSAELVLSHKAPYDPVDFYLNTSGQGNPIKWSLLKLIEQSFGHRAKSLKVQTNARRWRIAELMKIHLPETELPISKNLAVHIYQTYVAALVQTIIPDLVTFMQRGRQAQNVIVELESALRGIFPKEEGWHIEAPKGGSLRDFVKGGRINIYQQSWEPEENHQKAGLLSFALISEGECLRNMFIKISLYDSFVETGDELLELKTALKSLSSCYIDANTLWGYLPEPIRDPKIHQLNYDFSDHQEQFTAEVTKQFEILKTLTPHVDSAVAGLRKIQTRPWAELKDGVWNALLIRSALAETRTRLSLLFPELESENFAPWSMHIRHPDWTNSARLRKHFRIREFDIALNILVGKRQFTAEFASINPPHYEVWVLDSLLRAKFPHQLTIKQERLCLAQHQTSADFEQRSSWEWLNQFLTFADTQVAHAREIFLELQEFIQQRVSYISSVQQSLEAMFARSVGWVVEDHASSLGEQNGGFLLWHPNWHHSCHQDQVAPLLVVQVGSRDRLFTQPFLGIRYSRGDRLESYAAGTVAGWCSARLGTGNEQEGYLWYYPLPDNTTMQQVMDALVQLGDIGSLMRSACAQPDRI